MLADLIISLQITLVGMGLVFGAIVLLWGLIALLMRLTTDSKTHFPLLEEVQTISYADIEEIEQKRRAALAAVAVALAIDRQAPHVFPIPQTALVSAWQAVMRASNIRNRRSIR